MTGKLKLPPSLTEKSNKPLLESLKVELPTAISTWDHERTLKMTAFGFTVNGWYFYAGFHVLDRLIGPSKSFKLAATKAVMSQLFFSPPYLSAFLYYSAAYINPPKPGFTPMDSVIEKFPQLYASAWAIWPAVNLITFRYLPPGLARVAFLNVMGIGWNAYMAKLGTQTFDDEYAL
ncbi:hypothetical protein BDR26DRAFT_936331 [Obelidium mucronatum]|nr:hypothetical protein BDR26DRAFT_936331 [Obelidium mucronatum]